jgi:hypothetical protein
VRISSGEHQRICIPRRVSMVDGSEALYYLKDDRVEAHRGYEGVKRGHGAFREMAA